MCDTHVVLTPTGTWFAKNSDREPSEPQLIEYLPANPWPTQPSAITQQCTYIDVELSNHDGPEYACYISRPSWMWGAEMGVNQHGVCIGNEAVFTKTRSLKPALLGMDIVRLGLSHSKTSAQALNVMTQLLEQYGQGGPAGFRDKRFHYDSSFLIADATECWKLETAGKHWVAKRFKRPEHGAVIVTISNRLSIEEDFDLQSGGLHKHAKAKGYWNDKHTFNFAKAFETRLLPFFAQAKNRQRHGQQHLEQQLAHSTLLTWQDFAGTLRRHQHDDNRSPAKGSNADTCMHAGGIIRASQTTNSLIAELSDNNIKLASTGTSAPCLSLFKPLSFTSTSWSTQSHKQQESLWKDHDCCHRTALFNDNYRQQLHTSRDELEAEVFQALANNDASSNAALQEVDRKCMVWQQQQLVAAKATGIKTPNSIYGYYWKKLNKLDDIPY